MEKILLIDDEVDVQYSFRRVTENSGVEIICASSGEEGLKLFPKVKPDLVIMDIRMGGISGLETLRKFRQGDTKTPVILMTAYGTTQNAIEAMKLGAFDYLLKPFDIPKMQQLIATALKAARDMKQVVSYQPLLDSEDYVLGIVGKSEPMQNVFKMIGQLAGSDATALITGESGTGKELVARAIYHHSNRSEETFLAINCAAIPENLLESELFGHEKGAFTGANNQRIGKFEQCNRGTLFLDEIGDMSVQTQTKILRVLQSGEFERVGGNHPVKVNVRVIAATNKPLEEAVASRQFREDLFYRLNVVRVQMPPLRDRLEDIPILVNYFLKKVAETQNVPVRSISKEVLDILGRYHWPGNVRELQNVVQRACVMAKGDVILPSDLPPEVLSPRVLITPPDRLPSPGTAMKDSATEEPKLSMLARELFRMARSEPKLKVIPAVERILIIEALNETKGNQVQASKLLGITRATLRKRVEKFQIKQELSIQ